MTNEERFASLNRILQAQVDEGKTELVLTPEDKEFYKSYGGTADSYQGYVIL